MWYSSFWSVGSGNHLFHRSWSNWFSMLYMRRSNQNEKINIFMFSFCATFCKKKTIEGPFDLISRCSVIFCHTPTLSQLCRPDNNVNAQQTNNLRGFFIEKSLLDFVRFFLNSMKKNARKLSLYLVNLFVIFFGQQL